MCIRDRYSTVARTVDLSHVTTVVLDEADEMLNMGFYKDAVSYTHLQQSLRPRQF